MYTLPRPNRLWLNDGSGRFRNSGQELGDSVSLSVAMGDVDGDGDAWIGNHGANHVWWNDGSGRLDSRGQGVSEAEAKAITAGLKGK